MALPFGGDVELVDLRHHGGHGNPGRVLPQAWAADEWDEERVLEVFQRLPPDEQRAVFRARVQEIEMRQLNNRLQMDHLEAQIGSSTLSGQVSR